MIAFFTSLLSGPGTLFAGLAAVLALASGIWLKGRSAGVRSTVEKQRKSDAKARTIADEIDDAISGRDAETNRRELKKWRKP